MALSQKMYQKFFEITYCIKKFHNSYHPITCYRGHFATDQIQQSSCKNWPNRGKSSFRGQYEIDSRVCFMYYRPHSNHNDWMLNFTKSVLHN